MTVLEENRTLAPGWLRVFQETSYLCPLAAWKGYSERGEGVCRAGTPAGELSRNEPNGVRAVKSELVETSERTGPEPTSSRSANGWERNSELAGFRLLGPIRLGQDRTTYKARDVTGR